MSVKIDGDIGVIPIGNASGVPFTPVGSIAATNVQAALQEVDAEKVKKAGDTMTGELIAKTVGVTDGTSVRHISLNNQNGDLLVTNYQNTAYTHTLHNNGDFTAQGQIVTSVVGIGVEVAPTSGDAIVRVSKSGSANATLMATDYGLSLGVDGSGGTTRRMDIDTSGNITLNPGLVGLARAANIFVVGASGNNLVGGLGHKMAVRFAGGGNLYGLGFKPDADNTSVINFANASDGIVGSITQSPTAVAYNTNSDYRLKADIQPMQGALAKVALLNPCTFKWKADGSDGQGFIAHELQAVIPDAVTGEKDADQMQSVDTSFLVATLTAAIQELSIKLDTALARITELEAK